MTEKGIIFNIQRFSVNDGPGIRTTVFLKGCPLHCKWCHNPESISAAKEIVFKEERCIKCGECIAACQEGAAGMNNGSYTPDRAKCVRCGNCVDACPSGARETAGTEMSVEEVIGEIRKDTVFYNESGGGATFSGGEPLLQSGFLTALLESCAHENILTAVDTSGYSSPDLLKSIAGRADLFLYDLKTIDDEKHISLTGVSNRIIIENLKMLSALGKKIIVRIPVIPEFNDDLDEIGRMGKFISSVPAIGEVHLLPYHATGGEKYRRLGLEYPMKNLKEPVPGTIELLASEMRRFIGNVSIGG